MMPGLDGGELAARFQANPKLKAHAFPTAAITKEEVKTRNEQSGEFMAKPVVLKEMAACLDHHLG